MLNFEQSVDNQSAERQVLWEAKLADVKRIIDGIGGEMDPNIIETVVALNLQGIPTSASCEGHTDHGHPAPWVQIEAPEKPLERYHNQGSIQTKILDKYGLSRENIKKDEWRHVRQELRAQLNAAGETAEYKQWVAQNELYREQVKKLTAEYYQKLGAEVKDSICFHQLDSGVSRTYTGGDDYERGWDREKFSPEELRQMADRLPEHQADMQRFTEYLKERFLAGEIEK